MRRIFLFTFLLFIFQNLSAQATLNPAVITSALAKRGITEEEARAKLKEKGIEIDNIKVEDYPRVAPRIEEAIAELEREKKAKQLLQENLEDSNVVSDTLVLAEDGKKKRTTDNPKDQNRDVRRDAQKIRKAKITENQDSIKKVLAEKSALKPDPKKDSIDKRQSEIYGHQAFKNENIGVFKTNNDFKATDAYVLNTGDKLTITISNSRAFYNKTFEVNKEGFLELEKDNLQRVNVRSMTLGRAKKVLDDIFSRYYPHTPADFNISVSATRMVAVNIVGEVIEPGTYTLSAGNSAFNALIAAKGLSDIGSVRKIKLIRSTGEKKILDVYEFLLDPSVSRDFSLSEGDYIFVPTIDKVVTIKGAITRPMKYELIGGENLMKLVTYAGGFADSAYQANVQVKRFVDDREKIIDVNYKDLKNRGGDFELLKGDVVIVKNIPVQYENFATIVGAIELKGQYEITEGMRVSDLLKKAIVRKEARTDVAYLTRTNADMTKQLKTINVDEVLKNPSSPDNFLLQSKDTLSIFTKERFSRKDSIFVSGAVRVEMRYPYDAGRTVRVSDAINLAGGALPSATNFAYIIRRDTFNAKLFEYVSIDLKTAIDNPNAKENVKLMPNDSIYVLSREDFVEQGYIRVTGSVRKPGEYKYAKSLTLYNALLMANGLKLEAATNRVEVFRVILDSINPVRTVVASIQIDKSMNIIDLKNKEFELQPYDQIVVRSIPDFGFQKIVNLTGEVKYPGQYALIDKNEKLTSIIQRAGGMTAEAFADGATLFRVQDDIGYVIVQLPDALKNPSSYFNVIMKEGDVIDIPKSKDIVTIQGATRAPELYPERILSYGKINIAYEGDHNAWYYVDKYAAGVSSEGRKRLISVVHPNGEVKRTKDFFFFKIYPKVQKGSVIRVGYAEKKVEDKRKSDRKEIDWGKVLSDSIAQATALLTFIILIQRLQ